MALTDKPERATNPDTSLERRTSVLREDLDIARLHAATLMTKEVSDELRPVHVLELKRRMARLGDTLLGLSTGFFGVSLPKHFTRHTSHYDSLIADFGIDTTKVGDKTHTQLLIPTGSITRVQAHVHETVQNVHYEPALHLSVLTSADQPVTYFNNDPSKGRLGELVEAPNLGQWHRFPIDLEIEHFE